LNPAYPSVNLNIGDAYAALGAYGAAAESFRQPCGRAPANPGLAPGLEQALAGLDAARLPAR